MARKRPRNDDQHGNERNGSKKIQKIEHGTAELPNTASAALDLKYPATTIFGTVNSYDNNRAPPSPNPTSTSLETDLLPPLPPLAPGTLSAAPFTHPSLVDDKYISASAIHDNQPMSYDRLEFLGDAYLELIATRIIYARFRTLPTGRQAHLREKVVCNSTLAVLARRYGLSDRIRFAEGCKEQLRPKGVPGHAGGWEKVGADVFEAYVAAVILSAPTSTGEGFDTAERWLEGCWAGIFMREEAVVNRRDELQALIATKHVNVEYLDEDSKGSLISSTATPTSPGKPRKQKEPGPAGQIFYVGVYVTEWKNAPPQDQPQAEPYRQKIRQRLGGSSGVGKKEAAMKATMDAFDRSSDVIEMFALRKRLESAERKRIAAGQNASASAL